MFFCAGALCVVVNYRVLVKRSSLLQHFPGNDREGNAQERG